MIPVKKKILNTHCPGLLLFHARKTFLALGFKFSSTIIYSLPFISLACLNSFLVYYLYSQCQQPPRKQDVHFAGECKDYYNYEKILCNWIFAGFFYLFSPSLLINMFMCHVPVPCLSIYATLQCVSC